MTTTVQHGVVLNIGRKRTPKIIYAKQGDNDSRFVNITLLADDEEVVIEDASTVEMRAALPNGTTVIESATVNEDGTITAELSDNILQYSGIVKADIVVSDDNGAVISSEVFFIKVQKAPIS